MGRCWKIAENNSIELVLGLGLVLWLVLRLVLGLVPSSDLVL